MKKIFLIISILLINANLYAQFTLPSFQGFSNSFARYGISTLALNIEEGSEATITIATSKVINNTTLYWTIDHVSSSNADFVNVSGSFNISNNAGSFTIELANDANNIDVIDPETFTISIRKQSITGQVVATSNFFNIVNLPQIVEFDLMNAPLSGSTWTDATSGVSAIISKTAAGNNAWTSTANFGGGITFDENSKGYIEIPGVNTADNSFTISIAGNLSNHPNHYAPFFDGSVLNRSTSNIWANLWGGLLVGTEVSTETASTPSQSDKINLTGVSWWDFVYDEASVKTYRDGNLVISGTLSSANLGWRSKLRFANEYNQPGNAMLGTWYRIKYNKTALDQTAISTQFNSVRTLYDGLTGSIQFNGTNQYLETAGINILPLSNFTWEAFVYPTKNTDQQTFISNIGGSSDGIYFGTQNSTLTPIYNQTGSTTAILTSSVDLNLNQWNHVALVRTGGVMSIYVNGVQGASGNITQEYIHQTLRIGGQGARYFQGYMSNIRLVSSATNVNAAVYTGSSYTVPTTPLTSITNTQLLLNTINGGRFSYDASPNGFTFTNFGLTGSSNKSPF